MVSLIVLLLQLLILISLMSMIIHQNSLTVSIKDVAYTIIINAILPGLYRRTVPENVMIGSSIINITATDDDIAPNNIICYSILAEVEYYVIHRNQSSNM